MSETIARTSYEKSEKVPIETPKISVEQKPWFANFVVANGDWITSQPEIRAYLRAANLPSLKAMIEEHVLDLNDPLAIQTFLQNQANPQNRDLEKHTQETHSTLELDNRLEELAILSKEYQRLLTPVDQILAANLDPNNEIDAILLEKLSIKNQSEQLAESIRIQEGISSFVYKIETVNQALEQVKQEISQNPLAKNSAELTSQLLNYLNLYTGYLPHEIQNLEQIRNVLSQVILQLNKFNSNYNLDNLSDSLLILSSLGGLNQVLYNSIKTPIEGLLQTAKREQDGKTNLAILKENLAMVTILTQNRDQYVSQVRQLEALYIGKGVRDVPVIVENNRVYAALESQLRNQLIGEIQETLENHEMLFLGLKYSELENFCQGYTDTMTTTLKCIQNLTPEQREIANRTHLQKATTIINNELRTNTNLTQQQLQHIFVVALTAELT